MKNTYKEMKNFILITLAVLVVGSAVAFEVIAKVDFDSVRGENKINIIFDVDK